MSDEDVPLRPPGLDTLSQTVISHDANLQAAFAASQKPVAVW